MKGRILLPQRCSIGIYEIGIYAIAIILALFSYDDWIISPVSSLVIPPSTRYLGLSAKSKVCQRVQFERLSLLNAGKGSISEDELKQQLKEYLAKRKEANADEAAKKVKGKVVGGTRGNAVLEFVSGAPVKEQVIERSPDIFDYDELSRYG